MRRKLCSAMIFVLAIAYAITGCRGRSGVDLTGAGATFPNPIYSRWFSEFDAAHLGTRINYQSVGSGAGIRQVSTGIVDFGASDQPMTDRQLAESKVKLLHIPTVLGAVVPVYNVPGLTGELRFSPDVIADIFLGNIHKWNDPRIVADNPGVALPAGEILPVYRSDGSGTTYILTDYLSKVSPAFAAHVGRNTSVKWPKGIGEKGSEGVAGAVRNTPNTFGYVELIYATQNKMAYGQVKNAAGNWVKASPASVTAAAGAAADNMPADFRVSITNAAGSDSYPISSFTWLLIPQRSSTAAKGKVLHDFVAWMLDYGEAEASAMSYAPLPQPVIDRVRQVLPQIQ